MYLLPQSGKLLTTGKVVKELSNDAIYYCIQANNDTALVSPATLSDDEEWSFYINEARVISNKKEDYDLDKLVFLNK
jgi:hypothetical protein